MPVISHCWIQDRNSLGSCSSLGTLPKCWSPNLMIVTMTRTTKLIGLALYSRVVEPLQALLLEFNERKIMEDTWTIFGTCRKRLLEITWNDRNLEWTTAIWGAVLSTLSHHFWISCQPRNALVLVEVILTHQTQHHFQVNNFPCNQAIPQIPPMTFFKCIQAACWTLKLLCRRPGLWGNQPYLKDNPVWPAETGFLSWFSMLSSMRSTKKRIKTQSLQKKTSVSLLVPSFQWSTGYTLNCSDASKINTIKEPMFWV